MFAEEFYKALLATAKRLLFEKLHDKWEFDLNYYLKLSFEFISLHEKISYVIFSLKFLKGLFYVQLKKIDFTSFTGDTTLYACGGDFPNAITNASGIQSINHHFWDFTWKFWQKLSINKSVWEKDSSNWSFSCVLDEMSIEVSFFHKAYTALKNSSLRPCMPPSIPENLLGLIGRKQWNQILPHKLSPVR